MKIKKTSQEDDWEARDSREFGTRVDAHTQNWPNQENDPKSPDPFPP